MKTTDDLRAAIMEIFPCLRADCLYYASAAPIKNKLAIPCTNCAMREVLLRKLDEREKPMDANVELALDRIREIYLAKPEPLEKARKFLEDLVWFTENENEYHARYSDLLRKVEKAREKLKWLMQEKQLYPASNRLFDIIEVLDVENDPTPWHHPDDLRAVASAQAKLLRVQAIIQNHLVCNPPPMLSGDGRIFHEILAELRK